MKLKNYKVSVDVLTTYSTLVEAKSEEEAIQIALDRDAPPVPAYLDETMEYEWASEPLMEFPNLGKDEQPEIEEI